MDTFGPLPQDQTTFRTTPVQAPQPVQPEPQPPKKISTKLKPHEVQRLRANFGSDDLAAHQAYQIDPDFRRRVDSAVRVQEQLSPTARKKLATMLLNKHYHNDYNYKAKPTELTDTLLRAQHPSAAVTEPGFLGRIEQRQKQAFQNTLEGAERFHNDPSLQNLTSAVVRGSANMFSGLVAPFTETTKTLTGGAMKLAGNLPGAQKIRQAAPVVGQAVADSPPVKAASDLFGAVQERAPEELKDLMAVGKAGVDALDVYGTGQIAKAGVNVAREGLQAATAKTGSALKGVMKRDFDDVVAQGMAKGAKPQFRGAMRSSANSLPEYNQKASEAVRQILANKQNLQFTDDAGEVIAGQAPRNLSEFAQAIEQTKKKIFSEYSALTQNATGQGMQIDLDDIVDKLLDYADDPVKQLADSSKTQYALKMADRLMKQQRLDPKQAEELIAELNKSLAPTYAEKTAKGVSEVDLSIANILRQKLDDTVEQATGKDYQALKNAYGALKTIERDVGHRALVVARQNAKGFADMTDIFTGSDLVAAAFTMNPAFLMRGAAGFGIKSWYKNLNSPDANIMRMFYRASKLYDGAGKAAGTADDVVRAAAGTADDAAKGTSRVSEIRDMEKYTTDLQNHIAVIEEELSSLPDLRKFANRKTGEVAEVTGRGKAQFARKGDDMATEMGYEDSEALRESHGRAGDLRQQLAKLKADEKEARRLLEEMKRGKRPEPATQPDTTPPF